MPHGGTERAPPAKFLASGPNPPDFVLVTHSVQFGIASPLRNMHPRKGLASPRVGTYFCVRTFWPRPRVTVPNVAPGFRLPAALLEGMASRVPRTFVFQTFGLGLGYRCPMSHLGSWTQLVVRGRGGSGRTVAGRCPAVTVRSGFTGVSVWTRYFGARTEVVVKP